MKLPEEFRGVLTQPELHTLLLLCILKKLNFSYDEFYRELAEWVKERSDWKPE